MAGIYIHIPFCKQKCYYCNFFSATSLKNKDRFLIALKKEIADRKNYLHNEIINTIYFGGGTPSILDVKEIVQILKIIYSNYIVADNVEITFEANPDELTYDKIQGLKNNTNINRFSIGIQSFHDDDLIYLNRIHNSKNAIYAIEKVLKSGFYNLTIDLIYGIPGLTTKKWKENLDIFFSYPIPHLSAYSLTVESKTALDVLIKKNKLQNINENESINHFNILLQEAEQHNFIHYEISNFALKGYYSKHNSTYWLGGKYAGFGPSAHSFNGISRQWNILNIEKYCSGNSISDIIEEKEFLTKDQMYNEYIMTSLRTSWGCDTEHIRNAFGNDIAIYFINSAANFVKNKMITIAGNIYKLTDKGKLMADGIAADLFIE